MVKGSSPDTSWPYVIGLYIYETTTVVERYVSHLLFINAGTVAQLWIVGPIFVSSGLLVLIKSISHVYKRMRRETTTGQVSKFKLYVHTFRFVIIILCIDR